MTTTSSQETKESLPQIFTVDMLANDKDERDFFGCVDRKVATTTHEYVDVADLDVSDCYTRCKTCGERALYFQVVYPREMGLPDIHNPASTEHLHCLSDPTHHDCLTQKRFMRRGDAGETKCNWSLDEATIKRIKDTLLLKASTNLL